MKGKKLFSFAAKRKKDVLAENCRDRGKRGILRRGKTGKGQLLRLRMLWAKREGALGGANWHPAGPGFFSKKKKKIIFQGVEKGKKRGIRRGRVPKGLGRGKVNGGDPP